ncbi:hypothetical protein LguiB_020499 [Lonicera macranthoides]
MPRGDELNLDSGSKCNRKHLLQFDKNNRAAFYGIWSKKSSILIKVKLDRRFSCVKGKLNKQ